jgi:hypothetical protein
LPKKLPLVSLGNILSEALAPPSWLVECLISDGSRVVLYGEFGSYKSWGLLSLGLHIAAGQPWLGHFPIPHARRVLYVDEEMSERLLRRRVKRLAMGMEQPPELSTWRALSRHGVRCDAAGVHALLAGLTATGFEPEVIIVETMRRVLIGDEKEAKDVAEFWRSVAPILLAGQTLIVSHHMRKPAGRGGGRVRDRASGSTDILGGADDALAFERKAKDVVIVEHVKCRDGEEVEPFAVSLVEDGDAVRLRHEGSPAEFKAQANKTAQAEHLIERFLESAPEQTARTEELLSHLAARGISERTGETALRALKAREQIVPLKRGVYQLVQSADTPTNREAQPQHIHAGCGGSTTAALAPESSASAAIPQRFAVAEVRAEDMAMFEVPCPPIPAEMQRDAA